jgi:Flp pilus assembly protein TadG
MLSGAMLTGEMLRASRARGDAGSTMVLMPLGILIVVVLAAIAFDLSWVYEAQHEAIDAAESAANDAVTFGVDQGSVEAGTGVHLDDERITEAVDRSLAVRRLRGYETDRTTIVTDRDAGTITVTVTCHVSYLFARAVLGAGDGRDVTGSGTARLDQR